MLYSLSLKVSNRSSSVSSTTVVKNTIYKNEKFTFTLVMMKLHTLPLLMRNRGHLLTLERRVHVTVDSSVLVAG